MKKILLSTAAIALLFASSCKKSDDNNGPSNGWTLNGTGYNTAAAAVSNGVLTASSTSPQGAIFVTFGNATPTAGTYHVMNDDATLTGNQISFYAYSSNLLDGYSSTGSGSVDATVTVNGGKVSVSCPDVWVKKSATDSVKLSVNVTQTN